MRACFMWKVRMCVYVPLDMCTVGRAAAHLFCVTLRVIEACMCVLGRVCERACVCDVCLSARACCRPQCQKMKIDGRAIWIKSQDGTKIPDVLFSRKIDPCVVAVGGRWWRREVD